MIRIATWNTEWALPNSSRGQRIVSVLSKLNPDVVVLTESHVDLFPLEFTASGAIDWGYSPKNPGFRKVLVSSRFPLAEISTGIDLDIPGGRFISTTVQLHRDTVHLIGICIPWKDAHVRTGRQDRSPWEDHQKFLAGVLPAVQSRKNSLWVAGDFNQRIPYRTQPRVVSDLMTAFLEGMTVATAFDTEHPLIDHIAISANWRVTGAQIIPDHDDDGRLSDHRGVVIDLDVIC